jgi:hypothetical protein
VNDQQALNGILFVLRTGIDRNGIPVMFCVTGANRHDSVVFEELVDALPSVPGRIGKPRRWPDKLHADKGYDYKRCRAERICGAAASKYESRVKVLSAMIALAVIAGLSSEPTPGLPPSASCASASNAASIPISPCCLWLARSSASGH